MRAKIIYFLTIMVITGVPQLFAINTAPPLDNNVSTSFTGSGVLSSCSKEQVFSGFNDPILSKECTRIVCSGNFWGKSSTDICCDTQEIKKGSGSSEVIYKNCYSRKPLSKNSNEEWKTTRFYIKQPFIGCGNYLIPLAEIHDKLFANNSYFNNLLNSLFPEALASAILENTQHIEWTEAEKVSLSDYLYTTANLLEAKLAEGDPLEVGEEWSLFRQYTWSALYAARLLVHIFNPSQNACPSVLAGLCSITDILFHPLWTSSPCTSSLCILGETDSLNVLAVNQLFQVSSYSDMAIGTSASVSVHEAWHIIYHYANGLYQSPDPNDQQEFQTYDFPTKLNASISYEEESTARFVEAIFYHYLKQLYPELEAFASNKQEEMWDTLQSSSTVSLISQIPDIYKAYIYAELTDSQKEAVNQCIIDWFEDFPSQNPQDKATFTNTFYYCVAKVAGFASVEEMMQNLEEEIYKRGGPCGIGGPEMAQFASVTPCQSKDPNQAANEAESANTFGKGKYNVEGSLPAKNYSGKFSRSDKGESSDMVPDCVATWSKSNAAGTNQSCYDWCWDHFPGGNDGGMCGEMTRYDNQNNCNLSSGDKCEIGIKEACVKDPSGPYLKYCQELCSKNTAQSFCKQVCVLEPEQDFCRKACVSEFKKKHSPNFCEDLCTRDPNNSGNGCDISCENNPDKPYCDDFCSKDYYPKDIEFCHKICNKDYSHKFCGKICGSVDRPQDEAFCSSMCENAKATDLPNVYCEEICEYKFRNNIPSQYCDDLCNRYEFLDMCVVGCNYNSDKPYCEKVCAYDNSPGFCHEDSGATNTNGGNTSSNGCPSGSTTRRGSIPTVKDSCFPYVGEVCDSGGYATSAIGNNEACTNTNGSKIGWCGCPESFDYSWSGECIRPAEQGDWDIYIHYPGSRMFYYGQQTCWRSIFSDGTGYEEDRCNCIPDYYGSTVSVSCSDFTGLCCDELGTCVTPQQLGMEPIL